MTSKGFTDNSVNIETPNDIDISEKPLNPNKTKPERVDINILRSKLEEQQSREFKKNMTIFTFCIFLLATIGIYLSL
tara:strand:+ start:220 stop:450 length:231 start_codon:yes stop_codon:yes gene_type:complete